MSHRSAATPPPDAVRFGYFLLQTRVATDSTGAGGAILRMTVEDLSSGDKWNFGSTGELTRFLDALASDSQAKSVEG